ncbi:MAG TPA: NAD(P)-dependent alcohol dehydrogenase [Acidimicrobiia bacterium]
MTLPTADSTTEITKSQMKALVQSAYGEPEDVLTFENVDIPVPGDGQVLIRVHATSINALDWHFVSGTPYFLRLVSGLRTPKRRISGADVSGTVVGVGKNVHNLAIGDRVFGEIPGGGFAEYVSVREGLLAPVPSNITFAEAATLGVAALTALQGLRDWGGLRPGQSVLINGASGGVGTFAIQVARALDAGEITAVCSPRNVDAARSLGADHVIDYTREDFVSSDRLYDVMFDNVGNRALGECRSVLKPDGVLVMVTGEKGKWIAPLPRILGAKVLSVFWSQRTANNTANSTPEDLLILRGMVESGQVKPAVERTIGLEDVIGAISDQGKFHARAKTVVQIETVL